MYVLVSGRAVVFAGGLLIAEQPAFEGMDSGVGGGWFGGHVTVESPVLRP